MAGGLLVGTGRSTHRVRAREAPNPAARARTVGLVSAKPDIGRNAGLQQARTAHPLASFASIGDTSTISGRHQADAFSIVGAMTALVTGRKSHSEQIWSALPQITDIDSSREDFSVGPTSDTGRSDFLQRVVGLLPKCMRCTRSSSGVNEASTRVVVSCKLDWIAASIGGRL